MKTKRILVVDDDRDLVQTTKTFLEARGYEVSTAYSGVEARDELARQRPDLVVLDIMMDYDTDEPETERIPVIITSGFTKEIATKADTFAPMMDRDWPAAKFFEKPVKLAALADAIAGLLADGDVPAAERA
jgi:CheY-like chemotaxis protein